MYVTKLAEGSIHSCGVLFEKGKRTYVSSKDFEYLKKTFPDAFKFEGEEKPKKTETKTKRGTKKPKEE